MNMYLTLFMLFPFLLLFLLAFTHNVFILLTGDLSYTFFLCLLWLNSLTFFVLFVFFFVLQQNEIHLQLFTTECMAYLMNVCNHLILAQFSIYNRELKRQFLCSICYTCLWNLGKNHKLPCLMEMQGSTDWVSSNGNKLHVIMSYSFLKVTQRCTTYSSCWRT